MSTYVEVALFIVLVQHIASWIATVIKNYMVLGKR